MTSSLYIGLYDPCPCGSGAKYKFCCAAKAKMGPTDKNSANGQLLEDYAVWFVNSR